KDVSEEVMTAEERKQFSVERKQGGLKINPTTAEIYCEWGCGLDAYGINPDLPRTYQNRPAASGVNILPARQRATDGWVSFHDLPLATAWALRERLDRQPIEKE